MDIDAKFSTNLALAWRGELEFGHLIETATLLEAKGLIPLVAVLYKTWTEKCKSPYMHAAFFNLGVTLSNHGDYSGAEAAYRSAMALSASFLEPRVNLGSLFERMGQPDKAVQEWRWIEQNTSSTVAASKPMLLMALNHMGRVLETQKQLYEAFYYLNKSLHMEPKQPDVLHHWISLRQKMCAWPVYLRAPGIGPEIMREGTSAISMLNITDDSAEQLAAAQRYIHKKLNLNVAALSGKASYRHKKIRVGFCSSDFSLHPVSMLTVELYELLDRNAFEVFGYCWSPEDGSDLRQRVINAMDHFTRINHMSDLQAAEKIRADEIDILVDLQGQTAGARPHMLAYRPASVQVTYLGLPATTGFPFIDYVIADKFLIPESELSLYSEKPIYMPDVYQVSDRKRKVGATPTRTSVGLPEQGFVFCCFNNSYKFTPAMFDVWMNILKRVPGSVLWLLADNLWCQDNLAMEAQVRGVAPQRLVFAGRVLPESYLARYHLADLFLDSFPFNAGTTANDALWMGVPVLTLTGRAFASRMAGALLTAAKLPELITNSTAEYEERAVSLAADVGECERLRNRLKDERVNGVLFDTPRFVSNLEIELKKLIASVT